MKKLCRKVWSLGLKVCTFAIPINKRCFVGWKKEKKFIDTNKKEEEELRRESKVITRYF